MNIFAWMKEFTEKLRVTFGARIVFIGLQGSRARGEAQDGSDIDVVVLFDAMTAEDLERYRALVESMSHSELACGFVGPADVLVSWPRHDLFNFYNDTVPIFGELPEIAPFTKDDAMQTALVGASGIYHAACHAIAFDGEAAPGIFKSLFKNAFFVLQALQYVRTGVCPRSKVELSKLLEGDDALVLEVCISRDARFPCDRVELIELGDLLIRWADSIMRALSEEQGALMDFKPYLQSTEYIDFEEEHVAKVAHSIKESAPDRYSLIKQTFEYVRDQVSHSYDAKLHIPAAKASEVLEAGGSICWGKANLLAALLRANGIPSGLSYQVLTKGEKPDSGYMVHALNTVYVDDEHGWVRIDARGNREGIDAQFSLNDEKLAYPVRPEFGERDFKDNHADAEPMLMRLILDSDDILTVSSEAVLDRWTCPL